MRPAPGTLPLRGDLAHIALAGKHLAAHYVVPLCREVGAGGAVLHHQPREDAETGQTLAPGTSVELLDIAGQWGWICLGPQGPSGHVRLDRLSDDA